MIARRCIPANNTVDTNIPSLNFGIPFTVALKSTLNIVNFLFDCGLNPFLIPAGLRAIAFQIDGREITSASRVYSKAITLCIRVTNGHCSRAVDVSLSRLCGLGGLGGSSRTTTSGTAVVVRGLAGSSAATVVAGVAGVTAGGLVRRGSLLVVLVVGPSLVSGTTAGCLLRTRAPLTVSSHAIPTLQLLHLSSSQAAVVIAGSRGLLRGSLCLGIALVVRLVIRLRVGLCVRLGGILLICLCVIKK